MTDAEKIAFPVIASPKLDGIRALVKDDKLVSRALKPIRNRFIYQALSRPLLNGLDGELIIPGATFQATTSAVMREDGEPDFQYWVFDDFTEADARYAIRTVALGLRMLRLPDELRERVKLVETKVISSADDLTAYEADCLARGYEGVMLRRPDGPYKFGRSTEREGTLLKLKRFIDIEAEVVGFEELHKNANELGVDERGYAKRSTHKANQIPMGTLGALVLRHPEYGEFKVGSGFDVALRAEIWANRPAYLGRLAKIKFQEHGTKDKPRIPVFLGFRDPDDL